MIGFSESVTYERGHEIWKEKEGHPYICRPLQDLEKGWQGGI